VKPVPKAVEDGTHAPTLVADIAALYSVQIALALSITRAIIALCVARMARTLLHVRLKLRLRGRRAFAMTRTRKQIDRVIPFLYPMTQ
jgi:hypothetical protein